MNIVRGILSENLKYYRQVKKQLEEKLAKLPKGSIKERSISGRVYYYLQKREGNKIIQKYLGKDKPEEFIAQIKQRKALEKELKKAKESLKLLEKTKIK